MESRSSSAMATDIVDIRSPRRCISRKDGVCSADKPGAAAGAVPQPRVARRGPCQAYRLGAATATRPRP
ncbi:unnamed protein product [Sphagnum jensenii]|uniref:Uncharacterized protein n=1 Tax=Sphagnum jensenii TaxID=128206 RepID=A0ABP1AYH6_9BRYO